MPPPAGAILASSTFGTPVATAGVAVGAENRIAVVLALLQEGKAGPHETLREQRGRPDGASCGPRLAPSADAIRAFDVVRAEGLLGPVDAVADVVWVVELLGARLG